MRIEEFKNDARQLRFMSELEALCFENEAWDKEVLSAFAEATARHLFLLIDDERAVGYMILTVVFDEGEIERIGVIPQRRKEHLAKYLLCQILVLMQLNRCYLEVNIHNVAAKKLYTSCDFKIIGVRPNYYSDGSDALIMEWKRNADEGIKQCDSGY